MSTRCHVTTRKGLFTLNRGASGCDLVYRHGLDADDTGDTPRFEKAA